MVIRKEVRGWVVDGTVGGRRIRPAFQTKYEAEVFKREATLRAQGLPAPIKSGVGLKPAIREYFDKVTLVRKAGPTQRNEKQFFSRLYDYFGDVAVSEIEFYHVEEFQLHLRKTLTASSVNRMFNSYRNFFTKCHAWEYIAKSPTANLENLPLPEKPKKQVWTDEQIVQVLNWVEPWVARAIYFLALTGGRAGEIRRLTRQDVDLERRRAVTLTSFKGGGKIRRREIPLAGALYQFMLGMCNEAISNGHAGPQDAVFRNASGNPLGDTQLSHEMWRARKALGITGLSLHRLRDTFLTGMVNCNLSLEKVRNISGHSNLKMLQEYLNIGSESMSAAMEQAVDARVLQMPSVTSGHKVNKPTQGLAQ